MFANITDLCYLCSAKIQKPCKNTQICNIMEDILKNVSCLDEDRFRQRVMKDLGWSYDQYKNRRSGRTEVTLAERAMLVQIANEINAL